MKTALDHLAYLTDILRRIAADDCSYVYDSDDERPKPCTCAPCVAQVALQQGTEWRYRGASHQRTTNGFNPREAAIVAAWSTCVDDHRLSAILDSNVQDRGKGLVIHENLQPPTARDWYVATSVVQWLVTNVGSEVLRKAGWEYQHYARDRATIDARRREQEPLFAPGSHPEAGHVVSFDKSTWHGVIALQGAGEIEFHGSSVEGGCGSLLEDAEVIGWPVFVTRNRDGGLVRVTVPPREPPALAAIVRDGAKRFDAHSIERASIEARAEITARRGTPTPRAACSKCGGDREECGGCPANL